MRISMGMKAKTNQSHFIHPTAAATCFEVVTKKKSLYSLSDVTCRMMRRFSVAFADITRSKLKRCVNDDWFTHLIHLQVWIIKATALTDKHSSITFFPVLFFSYRNFASLSIEDCLALCDKSHLLSFLFHSLPNAFLYVQMWKIKYL